MPYQLLRRLLFLLPAEAAHSLAALVLRLLAALGPGPRGPARVRLWNLDFPGVVGLAAGMDKGQVVPAAWFRLGMGFVEIGTITPRPQPGNPKPRLFRLPRARAVINRMGFNNAGAAQVAARLSRLARPLPGPLFVNLGRNKDTPNDRAADDYVAGFRALAPHADAVVINVSSPNTPGLRALQQELGALVAAVAAARRELGLEQKPLLVKLSPDEDRLEEIALAAVAAGADGIIATNTTLDRSQVGSDPLAAEQGGLSGAPLRERAERACARLYLALPKTVPIIGVGGLFTAEDAYARVRAGASLLQLYTALVYEGPGAVRRLARGLDRLLARDGLTLQTAVGLDAARLAANPLQETRA